VVELSNCGIWESDLHLLFYTPKTKKILDKEIVTYTLEATKYRWLSEIDLTSNQNIDPKGEIIKEIE